jgi:hypothetical protein
MPIVPRWSQLRSVLKEAGPFLVAVWSVFVVMGACRLVAAKPDDGVQYAGHVLSLLTAPVMAFDILQRRRDFGRPTIVATLRSLVRRAIGAFRKPRSISLQGTLGGIGVAAGTATVKAAGSTAPATLEQRLGDLERDVRDLRAETRSAADGLSRRIDTLDSSLQRERHERQEGETRITKRIEDVAVGGIPLELVALTWVTIGTVFSIIPEQIAALLALR